MNPQQMNPQQMNQQQQAGQLLQALTASLTSSSVPSPSGGQQNPYSSYYGGGLGTSTDLGIGGGSGAAPLISAPPPGANVQALPGRTPGKTGPTVGGKTGAGAPRAVVMQPPTPTSNAPPVPPPASGGGAPAAFAAPPAPLPAGPASSGPGEHHQAGPPKLGKLEDDLPPQLNFAQYLHAPTLPGGREEEKNNKPLVIPEVAEKDSMEEKDPMTVDDDDI